MKDDILLQAIPLLKITPLSDQQFQDLQAYQQMLQDIRPILGAEDLLSDIGTILEKILIEMKRRLQESEVSF